MRGVSYRPNAINQDGQEPLAGPDNEAQFLNDEIYWWRPDRRHRIFYLDAGAAQVSFRNLENRRMDYHRRHSCLANGVYLLAADRKKEIRKRQTRCQKIRLQ